MPSFVTIKDLRQECDRYCSPGLAVSHKKTTAVVLTHSLLL
jgi:hypothetical protein